MAKTDSFFIRARATSTNGAFEQIEIPLGSYVDALGKSVLRIHNIAVQTYPGAPGTDWSLPANSDARLNYQITTQSQAEMIGAEDKAVVATGGLQLLNEIGSTGLTFLSQDSDIMPQMWKNGYLIAVEELYFAVEGDPQLATGNVAIVMECTVETLSQNAAMALALSQQ